MKRLLIILGGVISILIISLFFKKDESGEYKKITLSEVTHSVFYSPLYVAIENGYFNEEGLDIELVLTPGADKVATSVISKDADIGFSGPEATIYVYKNSSEKLITFASLTKKDGQFIVGDCSLKNNFTMNNLKGKSVLAGRSGGMPLLMFEYALYMSGIDKNELNIDTSVEFAGLAGAYIGGQGDFVNLFEPNALKVEQSSKGCVLGSLGDISGIVPYTAFYAREEYIDKNNDVIEKFVKVINKGLRYVHNNSSRDIAEVIQKQFIDTSLDELTILVDRYKEADSWYSSTFVSVSDYNRLQDIMVYGKTIDSKIDSSVLITNEFNK